MKSPLLFEKKYNILLLVALIIFVMFSLRLFEFAKYSCALDGEVGENYVIYNQEDELLCEKSSIEIGYTFITRDFCEYEITKIENHKGYAKYLRKIDVPQIKRKKFVANDKLSQRGALSKKICLYLTHNDESYRPSDGYDSIYGAGGIHDVAKKFQSELKMKDIEVVLDETLHIPHNSSAYSRSGVTAKKLLDKERPDAMFDVHRDGVSKSYYYYNEGGKDYSKIRIVVGKSNPNFNENYKFAQSIFAIGNSMYPWLFSDIYCGKGHYNQALQPTDLLFEMGTYLIEKDYVFNTLPLLAEVVDTVLFASLVDEEGDITIDDDAPATNDTPTIITPPSSNTGNESNTTNESTTATTQEKHGWLGAMILSAIIVLIIGAGSFLLITKDKNKKIDI